MKLTLAFLQLVRWPNLLFIIITQLLFYYCIILPLLPPDYFQSPYALHAWVLYLLIAASVCIAAGGYIINDYFDINIDQVNKPEKRVVEKIIKRRTAILLHWFFTVAGIAISFYVSLQTNFIIVPANIGCAALLWFYSTTFKKKLLSGNIIISALTAWTIVVLYFAVNPIFHIYYFQSYPMQTAMKAVFKFAVLYAGFAFIISLIREVVKDMEDMEGDARYGCNTMPIVWGVQATKVFTAVWLVVLISAIAIVQFYVLHSGWWWSALYSLLALVGPLLWLLNQLYKAQNSKAFYAISKAIKLIMLAGILSMFIIKFYL